MSEYKVKNLVAGEPKEWRGPHGVVYYIDVELEGHDKIVSIGKKAPDALKAGDTVYGDIIPTDYLADKFKPSPPPEKSSGRSQGSDGQYFKDLSSMPLDVLRTLMPYVDAQALVKRDRAYYGEVMTLIGELSNDLLLMSDNIRKGDEKPLEVPEKKAEKTWNEEAGDEING